MIRLKSLLLEETPITVPAPENTPITFPIFVEDTYRGNSCDEFHAFNDTGGRVIGGMNDKVNAQLEQIYKSGYNPMVTVIDITMDNKTFSVSWKVTINQSNDGKPWIGLYSRGAGGSDAIRRGAPTPGNYTSAEECRTSIAIAKRGSVKDIEQLKDYKYDPSSGCKVRQVFYKYTLNEWPPIPKPMTTKSKND